MIHSANETDVANLLLLFQVYPDELRLYFLNFLHLESMSGFNSQSGRL
jgi:hypothetical protein